MIISFAWTTAALLAGRKTVTRRQWTKDYADRFRAGMLINAYDRSPRHGGKQIALIKLTQTPTLEEVEDMPDSDYEAEGFAYMAENPETIPQAFRMQPGETMLDRFNLWRASYDRLWVIRFKIIRLETQ